MTIRLTPVMRARLDDIAAAGISVPTYPVEQLQASIVHVGVGGFHRAHMSHYNHELAQLGSRWGVRGLGLMAADAEMRDALAAQDHLYTLTQKADDVRTTVVVGSIVDYVFAAGDVARAASIIAEPSVRILSLTITEAGYGEPGVGERTTCDVLADCLDARRQASSGPITILSCDNLQANGDVCRQAILNAAGRRDGDLARWIETNCTFPNSMVDRITPATVAADRQHLRDMFGIEDRCPVVCEPYRQWVVEDDFIAGRPEWERVGVQFTSDVHAWELYKLRFLNAGHSAIASLCSIAGVAFVDEALAMGPVHGYLDAFMRTEVLPTLDEIPGHPREDYIATVLARFHNRGVRDQIHRLCIDGTDKLATFLVPIVESNLQHGGPLGGGALALAAWGHYLATTPPEEQASDARGPASRAAAAGFLEAPLNLLSYDAVFSPALRDSDRFRQAFADAAHRIATIGAIDAMAEAAQPSHPTRGR